MNCVNNCRTSWCRIWVSKKIKEKQRKKQFPSPVIWCIHLPYEVKNMVAYRVGVFSKSFSTTFQFMTCSWSWLNFMLCVYIQFETMIIVHWWNNKNTYLPFEILLYYILLLCRLVSSSQVLHTSSYQSSKYISYNPLLSNPAGQVLHLPPIVHTCIIRCNEQIHNNMYFC